MSPLEPQADAGDERDFVGIFASGVHKVRAFSEAPYPAHA